jgi:histidyl-tRNA synthetase
VRAGIENGILHNQIQRLWYQGPMFRHERPQKGRYRQFHQIGVEVFGLAGPDIDAELLLMTARLWRTLGLGGLSLQINSLGTPEARQAYRRVLVEYFERHSSSLDDDSRRRLEKNPLRILDSKNPAMQEVIAGAPALADHLDSESRAHFDGLRELLARESLPCTVNPRLVRGLDYYTRTVFEWTTDRLGAQSAVCAGGRYDGLVERLGGHAAPAAGFAIGLERLIELLALDAVTGTPSAPHVYVVVAEDVAAHAGLSLAERLRDNGLRVQLNCGQGALKSQFRRADRSGARLAVIVDAASLARGSLTVKDLRGGEQADCGIPELADHLKQRLA